MCSAIGAGPTRTDFWVPPAPGVEQGGVVGIRCLTADPGLQTPDMGALTDIRLMDAFGTTPPESMFSLPPSVLLAAQALEASDWHTLFTCVITLMT